MSQWSACCAVVLPLVLLLVLVIIEIIRTRREVCTTPSPMATATALPTNAVLFGMKNWQTVQNMVRWQGEVSRIDGLIADLNPPPPPAAQ